MNKLLIPEISGGVNMKKLIAISVLFALLATAAFAQFSGGVRVQWNVVDSDGTDTFTSLYRTDAGINISASEETVGGRLSFGGGPGWGGHYFAWWKPIPQIKLQLGRNGDGNFGYDGIIGWGYHQGDVDFGHVRGYAFGDGGGGGFNKFGFSLALTPIDGLEVDFALPIGSDNAGAPNKELLADAFKEIYVGASYNISGIGTAYVHFSTVGNVDGEIGFGFNLGAVENLEAIIIAKLSLTKGSAFGLSLAAKYTAGDFGVKFRAGTTIGGDAEVFNLNLQVTPWYNFGFMNGYFNLGLGISKDGFGYFDINPYVTKSIGPAKVAAGVQVTITENSTTFALPLTINYSF